EEEQQAQQQRAQQEQEEARQLAMIKEKVDIDNKAADARSKEARTAKDYAEAESKNLENKIIQLELGIASNA
ncbi:MAG: hypothetical protein KJO69_08580, partial [Gammaproteobacteria bacterium]|nr:hypothetical protein [Gammaproteobacteria bacterium]